MDSRTSKYKIHSLNVNSISRIHKRHFLAKYLHLHKPDLLLLSETCLHARHKLNFENYQMVRTNMGPGLRGTAILVKNSIQYRPFHLPFSPNFEYTAISLSSGNSRLYVFSIYIHSNQLIDTDDFASVFNGFAPEDFLLLGGDFNAKHTSWANYNNNSNGIILESFLASNQNFSTLKLISSNRPTRFATNSFSFIDLFLLTNNVISDNYAKTYPFESDHMGIEIFITLPCLDTVLPVTTLNFNKTNWRSVKQTLSERLQENLPPINQNINTTDIDNYIDFLEDTTVQVVTHYTPLIKIYPKYRLELDNFTLKCIHERRVLRRRWFSTGRSNTLLKSFINRLTKIISQLIAVQYNKKLEVELEHLKPGPKIFNEIKKFSGKTFTQPPVLQNCVDEAASAELLAGHFAEVHNLSTAAMASSEECPPNAFARDLLDRPPPPIISFSNAFLADGSSSANSLNQNPFVDISSVSAYIKTRKGQKSRGEGQISNFIIKKLPEIFILFLTILINHCFNLSYFPSRWKHATIVPIPKGCSYTSDHRLYRPISLLSAISKIYEMAIKKQINKSVETLSAFNPLQFGFVSGRSTSHAITLLLEDVHMASFKKLPTLALTIDLHKAFDSVWINGLIFKMHLLNFPLYLILIVLNFLTNRSFQVRFKSKTSSKFHILAGVPQGSILGPILFNIYIHDFPTYFDPAIKTIFFADDILLYTSKKHIPSAISRIENYLKIISEYLQIWKLKVNYAKCESILFRKSDTHIPKSCKRFKTNENLKIVFGQHQIECVSKLKYLGITFDNKLSVIPHVRRICTLVNAAFASLKSIFCNSKISMEVKILAYKQLLRPLLLYGFVGWCHISSHQMAILRSLERKILYKCLPREVAFVNTNNHWRRISRILLFKEIGNIQRLDIVLVKNIIKFFNKLEFFELVELSSLSSSDVLTEKFNLNTDRFRYKCFPPSLLFYTHQQNMLFENEILRFYNRRYNSIRIDDYVYDMLEPD